MISNPVKNAFVDKTCFRMEGHISPVIGPVDPQHHPTDQYIGVQCGREFAAIIRENQASLVELHWYPKQW